MKTNIEAKQLANIVKTVSRVVSRRTNLPILTNLHMRFDADRLTITGTDLDVFCGISTPSACDPGELTTGAASLSKALGACKGLTELRTEEAVLHCVNGSSFQLATLPADEFPVCPKVGEEQKSFYIGADTLAEYLKRVVSAQSSDETRYVINGVFIAPGPDGLVFCATDGRRLHLATVQGMKSEISHKAIEWLRESNLRVDELNQYILKHLAENKANGTVYDNASGDQTLAGLERALQAAQLGLTEARAALGFILPRDTVKHLLAMLPKKNADKYLVNIAYDGKHVAFTWSNGTELFEIVSKLIDGTYPNYRQVIPEGCAERITFNPAEFAAVLRNAQQFTSEKANSVKLAFTRHICTITGGNGEGTNYSKAVAINYIGKEFAIAFDPEYLAGAFEALQDQDSASLELIDELSPGKVVCLQASFLAVIMPMRLS